jgi:small-conductance mechanosensitive channel
MRRAKTTAVGPDYKITRADYYQITISVLMVILGIVILFRSFEGGIGAMTLLVGGGFLGLGCYRLKFVLAYFMERRKCSRR